MTGNTASRGVSVQGDVTGSLVNTGDNNRMTMSDSTVKVVTESQVNPRAEFELIRELLLTVNTVDRGKIRNALNDVDDELSGEDPNRNEIGHSLRPRARLREKGVRLWTAATQLSNSRPPGRSRTRRRNRWAN